MLIVHSFFRRLFPALTLNRIRRVLLPYLNVTQDFYGFTLQVIQQLSEQGKRFSFIFLPRIFSRHNFAEKYPA